MPRLNLHRRIRKYPSTANAQAATIPAIKPPAIAPAFTEEELLISGLVLEVGMIVSVIVGGMGEMKEKRRSITAKYLAALDGRLGVQRVQPVIRNLHN